MGHIKNANKLQIGVARLAITLDVLLVRQTIVNDQRIDTDVTSSVAMYLQSYN